MPPKVSGFLVIAGGIFILGPMPPVGAIAIIIGLVMLASAPVLAASEATPGPDPAIAAKLFGFLLIGGVLALLFFAAIGAALVGG